MLQLASCSGHSDHSCLISLSGDDMCSRLFLFAVTAASSELNKLSNTFLQVRYLCLSLKPQALSKLEPISTQSVL